MFAFLWIYICRPFVITLRWKKKQYLLDEGKDGNILCGKNEKELINLLYSYLMKFHSNSPPSSEIIEVCKAAIELFPYLRLEPSGYEGIVSYAIRCDEWMESINKSVIFSVFQDLLYNAKARSGYLYHKIKNEKSKAVKPATEFTEDDLKRFLGECVVTKDQKKIKETLAQTVPIRRQLLKENSEEFRKFLKFYFADSSLVHFYFFFSDCF